MLLAVAHPGVVAGRDRLGLEAPLGLVEQLLEADLGVADGAGVGGEARLIAFGEGVHHALLEGQDQVDGVVREAQELGDALGLEDGACVAAAGFGVVERGDPDQLVPRLLEEVGGDGTVDPAAESDCDFLCHAAIIAPRRRASSGPRPGAGRRGHARSCR
ncbi:hypothetical protein D3C86_1471350 [compost metagenome]